MLFLTIAGGVFAGLLAWRFRHHVVLFALWLLGAAVGLCVWLFLFDGATSPGIIIGLLVLSWGQILFFPDTINV